jgi:hypothetical protein
MWGHLTLKSSEVEMSFSTPEHPNVSKLYLPTTPGKPAAKNIMVPLSANGDTDAYLANYAGKGEDIYMDVQGYIDGQPTLDGGWNPVQERILNTTTFRVPLKPGEKRAVKITGVAGIPDYIKNIAGIGLNLQALPKGKKEARINIANSGNVYVKDGKPASNYSVVQPDANGTMQVINQGSEPVDLIIDSNGWWKNTNALPPATNLNPSVSGQRSSAAMQNHALSDLLTWVLTQQTVTQC